MRAAPLLAAVLLSCGGRPPKAAPGAPVAAPLAPDAAVPAASPVAQVVCDPGPGRAPWNPYDEPRELRGDNGTFADRCDASGNLVSYQCEQDREPCPRRDDDHTKHAPSPCFTRTGRVEAATIDCDGQCQAGACAVRCPKFGDRLTYQRIDAQGNPVFSNAADPRRFACKLLSDARNDAYDCKADARPGDTLEVAGLGLSTSLCTGGTWGAVSDRKCTYGDCHFVYEP